MRIPPIPVFSIFSLLLFYTAAFGQLNMVLQDSMDYDVGVNDVCGWAAPDGREYALVGLNTGVSIVDINNDTLTEVVFVPGVNNLWRDINTFGHYAYVTSEARVGLLIINLEFLPDSVQSHYWFGVFPTPAGDKPFEKAHSLNIDENGIALLNGSNLNSGGVVLVDVKTNPEEPVFLGYAPTRYSHDCMARDSILYSAEIYNGDVSIYDIHDPQNVTLLGRVKTPHEFPHNIALSPDGQYMYTTDERANSYVTSYDISDLENIREADRFRQAVVEGSGAIVHNVFAWEDWLILAYYSSGTLIVDASRPDNLIEVGNFDSFLGGNGGYEGVWGAYPWLPSGKILASDRTNGLFVFIPNYVRAAFLEGTVIDSITGLPISNAEVSIMSDEVILPQRTVLDGTFKTGKAVPGMFPIKVTKAGYHSKTIEANFINGEVLTPVIELSRLPEYVFLGKIIDSKGHDKPSANVVLSGSEGIYYSESDDDGIFIIPSIYAGDYELQAGVWGETFETDILIEGPQSITIQLGQGYKDDFDLNLGWSISGNANEGQWDRCLPPPQLLFDMWQCSSFTDSPFDNGHFAYSTGCGGSGLDASNDEVSGGYTFLLSPAMDLDSIAFPVLSFDYWLCEYPPNQYLGFKVWLTNGTDTTLVEEFANPDIIGLWETYTTSIDISGPRENIQILFSASDTTSGTGNYYLKAHIDNFKLVDSGTGTHDETSATPQIILYPNPVYGTTIYLKADPGIRGDQLSLKIWDLQGRIISSQHLSQKDDLTGINHSLEEGIYFLQWYSDKGENGVEKIIVLKK